jgi:release factor glutamine methyltransferase
MIQGLSHLTLITRDLQRMSTILETVLDGRELYASGDATFSVAREKFYDVGGVWVAIMEGEPLPTRTYNHIAFKIEPAEFDAYRDRIERLGLELREPRPRVEGEGRSLYFYDDDNHLFELHAGTLDERLRRYEEPRARIIPPACGECGPEGRVGVVKPERGRASDGLNGPAITGTHSPGRTTPTPAPPRKGEGIVGSGRSRAEALTLLRRAFAGAGLEEAALEARLLLLGALELDGSALVTRPDEALTAEQAARLEGFARRRLAREPVARILGEREFWSLPFALSPETLVPRPETETVVETVLALRPDRKAPMRLLDLGTGSGCLLVALLHEYGQAFGVGLDRSLGALATARRNAFRNGVGARAAFAQGDWAASLRGSFDVIVSNPPYIRTDVLPTLEPDVRIYDPSLALDGGQDGLDAYRTVLHAAGRLLGSDGILALEIGYDQEAPIRDLAPLAGLDVLRVAPDLGGHPRCVALKRTRS